MVFSNWLDIWQNKYIKHSVKPRTFLLYRNFIEKHIKVKLGHYEMDDLNPQILQEFVWDEQEHGNLATGGKLATNSVFVMVAVLKRAIYDAYSLEVTKVNGARKIKLPRAEEKKVSAFEKKEREKIRDFCLANRKKNYIGIVLCLYTGIRIGELLALTWEDIDFENRLMTISKSVYSTYMDGKPLMLVGTPKTQSSARVLPLSRQLIYILKGMKKKSKSQYVITTRFNTMVSTRSYQKTFESILKKCKVPYRNFHSLRHTFATHALEFGMDVKTVSELLGHKDPIITLSRYTHSLMSYKIEMMNKLGKEIDLEKAN